MHPAAVKCHEADIRSLTDHETTVVYFQPKVHLQTGEIAGFEALLRLLRDDGSVASPLERFEALEELPRPLRTIIHHDVMVRVLPDAYLVQRAMDLPVAVNIHPDLLGHEPSMRWLLQQEAGGMILELTETGRITDFSVANEATRKLRRRGYKISIDDFGKGYSTASVLAHLACVDEVKIDANFLRSPRAPKMLPGMCHVVHEAGAVVTIEGVESPDDHDLCRAARANYAQGYWYGVPAPADVVTHMESLRIGAA